ncbi:hypothetical protein [Methanonatronarchaeum sp. AMET6-2]|uniref:hypothetical protein n=1 Tax=Methanonatronarchaeum sp. AMET6-2 TaxID=2933293 RepID=UPI00120BAB9E|nr:hypothetical protein [Methanonatronarchaeum sp. AMET6-2]RZN60713.1 MAG: hypothetical protein EF811_06175 [Methanonatronarchaeia archaeon]UOY09893.1 hypothetical protein MU439_06440 [Methanonatronarchaeum sp. AMET6-2]
MLSSVVAILAGLVLLTGLLGVIPALGDELERFASWLGGFQGLIGIVAIVIGILEFGTLESYMLIIAGLVLAAGILQAIPALGKYLEKMGRWLGGFQVIIGIITLVVGIMGLL